MALLKIRLDECVLVYTDTLVQIYKLLCHIVDFIYITKLVPHNTRLLANSQRRVFPNSSVVGSFYPICVYRNMQFFQYPSIFLIVIAPIDDIIAQEAYKH